MEGTCPHPGPLATPREACHLPCRARRLRGAPGPRAWRPRQSSLCPRSGGALGGRRRPREHARACGALSRAPRAAGALSAPLALVSGPCAVLTISHSQDLPEPAAEKASRRKKQPGSCFLLRQVYFSSQLCLTKTSLCGRRLPKKGLIHPALDSESAAASRPGLGEARARSPGSCRTSSVGWRLGPAPISSPAPGLRTKPVQRPRLSCAPRGSQPPCPARALEAGLGPEDRACTGARAAVKFGS